MGLGKTITVVSLIANTLTSASNYAGTLPIRAPAPAPPPKPIVKESAPLTAAHFAGSVWGMPDVSDDEEETVVATPSAPTPSMAGLSAKAKSKMKAAEQRSAEELSRAARIKTKSRATLVVCPLSTVVNWEDQFKEHWAGEVIIVGGATGIPIAPSASSSITTSVPNSGWNAAGTSRGFPGSNSLGQQGTNPLRVYVYHGTSRRPDPNYLADFDAVITTYSTLASEFSKQSKSLAAAAGGSSANGKAMKSEYDDEEEMEEDDDDDDDGSSDGIAELDPYGREIPREKKKKTLKRKKPTGSGVQTPVNEISSPLQMVNWFRVVLDEAQCVNLLISASPELC